MFEDSSRIAIRDRGSISNDQFGPWAARRVARFVGSRLVLLIALVSLPGVVQAAGGVLEINSTCATSVGCFPGDTPGYPVEITTSAGASSFRLTGDLDVTSESSSQNVTAIHITAGGMTIDLGGFQIIGPGSVGTGDGIDAATVNEITIRNGVIRGMGDDGLVTDRRARIQDVRAFNNGGDGIETDIFSVVQRCTADGNGGYGIDTNAAAVTGNSARLNGLDGIRAGNGSAVYGNSSNQNVGDGIQVRFDSVVVDNALRSNGGFGLHVPSGISGYGSNAITDLGGGETVGGAAIQIGTNICDTDTTCP